MCRGSSQLLLDGSFEEFSGAWPGWGTMRSGRCYRLPPLVPATYGRGSSLWPTPNSEGGTGYMSGSKRDVWRPTLEKAVQMCPEGDPPLIRRAEMFPTPSASGFGVKDTERLMERREECKAKHKNGNGFGLTLEQYVSLFPTPSASPWRSGRASSATHARNSRPLNEFMVALEGSGELNPTWEEWLLGFPLDWTRLDEDESEPSAMP